MKEKKLLEALGNVDESYIAEIYETPKRTTKTKPRTKLIWAAAAVLCAIALLTGAAWQRIYLATSDLDNLPLVNPAQVADQDIHLTATNVNAAGMRVYCDIDGVEEGKDAIQILVSGPFTIEKKTAEGWELLTPRFTDSQWEADTMLAGASPSDWPVNWTGLYGILEPGTYRYQTVVLEGKAPSSVEFTVADHLDDDIAALLRTTLDSHSYCVRHITTVETGSLDHLNATDRAAIEEMTQDYAVEYWRYGSQQLNLSYVEGKIWSGMLYKQGHTYYLDHEGDDRNNPVIGWNRWTELDRNRLTEWASLILETGPYELRDAADGSGKELVQVTEKEYEYYGVTAVWTTVWEFDTSDPSACADQLAQQDVNTAAPFSWELEKQSREPLASTFVNTQPQPITTAPEAVDRALAEYSGEYTKAIVYRDEAAGMWKVEFQRDYGYLGYRYVYLDNDGITQMIAEGKEKTWATSVIE